MRNMEEFNSNDTFPDGYEEQVKMNFDKRKKMISDDSYIRWLENFTNTYAEFSSDTWNYDPDKISVEDYKNVINLDLFFRAISDYAEDNFLESEFENTGFNDIYFIIKFNDIAYRIGIIVGQGSVAYCHRLNSIPSHYINFNNILENKGRDDWDIVQDKFNNLSNLVKSLRKLKVSRRAIREIVEKALK